MQSGLTIRTATIDDHASICQVLRELDDHHVRLLPDVFQPFDDPTLRGERIARFVDGNDAELFVAQVSSDLVGLATVRISGTPDAPMFRPEQRACLDDLVVRYEYRGQGIGKQLLARVAEWTRSRELQFIDINVWDENKVGTSFFENNGFRPRCRRLELNVDKAT